MVELAVFVCVGLGMVGGDYCGDNRIGRSAADYVKMVRTHHARTDGVLKALLGDTEEQVCYAPVAAVVAAVVVIAMQVTATAMQLVPDIVKNGRGKERLLEMKVRFARDHRTPRSTSRLASHTLAQGLRPETPFDKVEQLRQAPLPPQHDL
jgi:hypothetical protein